MGFLGKVLFWRKEKENNKIEAWARQEIKEPGAELWSDKLPEEEKTVFSALGQPPLPGGLTALGGTTEKESSRNRDLELINSKLDAIKAMLTSLEQRMITLEKTAGIEEKKRLW